MRGWRYAFHRFLHGPVWIIEGNRWWCRKCGVTFKQKDRP